MRRDVVQSLSEVVSSLYVNQADNETTSDNQCMTSRLTGRCTVLHRPMRRDVVQSLSDVVSSLYVNQADNETTSDNHRLM